MKNPFAKSLAALSVGALPLPQGNEVERTKTLVERLASLFSPEELRQLACEPEKLQSVLEEAYQNKYQEKLTVLISPRESMSLTNLINPHWPETFKLELSLDLVESFQKFGIATANLDCLKEKKPTKHKAFYEGIKPKRGKKR